MKKSHTTYESFIPLKENNNHRRAGSSDAILRDIKETEDDAEQLVDSNDDVNNTEETDRSNVDDIEMNATDDNQEAGENPQEEVDSPHNEMDENNEETEVNELNIDNMDTNNLDRQVSWIGKPNTCLRMVFSI